MLEEFEDSRLRSPKRSRPAWPDASVGVDATAKNGLRASPFSFCETKPERADETALRIYRRNKSTLREDFVEIKY